MQKFTSDDLVDFVLERWNDQPFKSVEQPPNPVLNYRIKIDRLSNNAR
jgi:hypothetical protein